ncbi:hypothetical protein ANCDUO_09297, partial [Ancylostoma duodenale]
VNGTEIDAAAIHTEQSRVVDPLDYVPETGPIEDLDLPNILPDLPGIAEDLTLLDGIVPSIFPDISLPVEEPSAASESQPPTETIPDSAPAPSLPQPNDRADLMAAIRAAGGAGKAKLKSVKSTRRSVKESESLNSSAPSDKNPSPGNSLMESLAKALEARRKAISGMSPSVQGTVEGIPAGSEAAGRSNDGCNSGDDDWK